MDILQRATGAIGETPSLAGDSNCRLGGCGCRAIAVLHPRVVERVRRDNKLADRGTRFLSALPPHLSPGASPTPILKVAAAIQVSPPPALMTDKTQTLKGSLKVLARLSSFPQKGPTLRRVTYGNRGRPSTTALDLEELILILQGAIESVDAERFVLERDQAELPKALRSFARNESYEVAVVGKFHTLVQRWLERQGLAAVWERPVARRSVGQGRHPTIDISLFGEVPANRADAKPMKRELRLEFGFFQIASPKQPKTKRVDHAKLQADADKLYSLRNNLAPITENFVTESFVLLWRIANERNTGRNLDWHQRALTQSAAKAMANSTHQGIRIDHLLTSSVDLIAAKTNEHRVAYVAAFRVT